MYWGIVCPLYGISFFLPTIINQLGYTASNSQLLTIPIYVTASILTIVVCYFSDRSVKGELHPCITMLQLRWNLTKEQVEIPEVPLSSSPCAQFWLALSLRVSSLPICLTQIFIPARTLEEYKLTFTS